MNILLDLDGTLTDPRVGIVSSIQHALKKLGRDAPADAALLRFIGPPLRDAFRDLLGSTDPALVEQAIGFYRERYSTVGLLENELYPGIPEALSALQKRGIRLFVATSKPGIFARRILEHFQLADYFRGIWGCELDGTRSDKTSLIAHVLEQERLPRQETVMVGDRSHDAVGALSNGLIPIGALWGYGNEEELISAGCKRLLRTPSELARFAMEQSD